MKRRVKFTLALTGLVVIFTASIVAQSSFDLSAPVELRYKPNTEQTVDGTIKSIHQELPRGGGEMQVFFILSTSNRDLRIEFGPLWFYGHQAVSLKAGDQLTVTGSRLMVAGRSLMLARTLEAGGVKCHLREESGWPVWRAWRTTSF